jgi:glutamate racemase
MKEKPIGIFDSGVGGLKILAQLRKILPSENYVYVFDRSHAPYGTKSARFVTKRAKSVTEFLLNRGAKIIVVACNTATGVAIDFLRQKYGDIFVGVEPPVKSASMDSREGKTLVLLTPVTARQQKFITLFGQYNDGSFIVSPQPNLASEIERNFVSLHELRGYVRAILQPYCAQNVTKVVLGCTHYYYVADIIKEVLGENVAIYTAQQGVANRVKEILTKRDLLTSENKGFLKYIYL